MTISPMKYLMTVTTNNATSEVSSSIFLITIQTMNFCSRSTVLSW